MSGKGRLFLSPPHMNGQEMGRIAEAFASNYIAPLGPMVDAFERAFSEYTGMPHCVALSSGTSATHLALRHLGGGDGDVVLASTLTFIGSVTPAIFERCETRFVDSDPATWNMDVNLLERAIEETLREGRRIRAAIPTDLYGQPCNLDGIGAACAQHGIPVICDSAEAMGARYRKAPCEEWMHAGYDSWAAVYSFNGNKIMTTSGGGMLVCDDAEAISHARYLSTQARMPVGHYEHIDVGYNYRLSNILAALGRAQLTRLDQMIARRRAIRDLYAEALADVEGVRILGRDDVERSDTEDNCWLTCIEIDPTVTGVTAKGVIDALAAQDIESRPLWKPMHLQPVFSRERAFVSGVSERLFTNGVTLPSGSALHDHEIERVIEVLRDTFGEH